MPRYQQRDLAEIWRTVYCPPNDPANVRPRSFSTASMDGDNAEMGAVVNKQASAANTTLAIEKNLTRAHSCDNLAPSPSMSSDNLSLVAEKGQGFLHRTGSDSSLTKIGGGSNLNALHNSGAPPNVERDTEEVLRSLVDTVEKNFQGSSDYSGAIVEREKRLSDLSFDVVKVNSVDHVAKTNEMNGIEAKTDINYGGEGIDRSQDHLFSVVELEQSRMNTVSSTTIIDQIVRGTDMSTSTTDLNRCCGNGIPMESQSTNPACRRVNGYLCDLNDNCPVALPDGCGIRVLSSGGRMVNFAEGGGTNAVSPLYYRILDSGAAQKAIAGRRGKPSPKDLIDTDGMTRILDAPQQRVREMINSYEVSSVCILAFLFNALFRIIFLETIRKCHSGIGAITFVYSVATSKWSQLLLLRSKEAS